jgi:anthranilate phosphoribosyltransferase
VGLQRAPQQALMVADLESSAALLRRLLSGAEQGPARSMLVLNAAAAIRASGLADDWTGARRLAEGAIDSGAAARALEKLIKTSASA